MKVNGRNILQWLAEKMRTAIYIALIAKGRRFVYLFIKLIFRQSNTICIGPLFYYLVIFSSNDSYVIMCF